MDTGARKILGEIAKEKEVSLSYALGLAKRQHHNHLDQYPLSLLLEEGYVGCTLNHTPPEGAENMREYSLSITHHMMTMSHDPEANVEYRGVRSSGPLDPTQERVFIKAKGALYIDEIRQKRKERIITFLSGLTVGLLVAYLATFFKK